MNNTFDDEPHDQPGPFKRYQIGHGKPPKHTQFKKGRSGNPNGRPKKDKDANRTRPWGHSIDEIGRLAKEIKTVMIDGKPTAMSVEEITHRKRVAKGMTGENRLITEHLVADFDKAHERQLDREIAHYLELKKLQAEGMKARASALARGEPAPILLPDPDDIVIDDKLITATVNGPTDADDLAVMQCFLRFRDHIARRCAYQQRYPPLGESLPASYYSDMRDAAEIADRELPARLRFSDYGFGAAVASYRKLGMRTLEKLIDADLATLLEYRQSLPLFATLKRRQATLVDRFLRFQTVSKQRRMHRMEEAQVHPILVQLFGEEATERVHRNPTLPRMWPGGPVDFQALSPEVKARLGEMEARARQKLTALGNPRQVQMAIAPSVECSGLVTVVQSLPRQ